MRIVRIASVRLLKTVVKHLKKLASRHWLSQEHTPLNTRGFPIGLAFPGLAELEHRTKNNFALVASMLEIQKGRLTDESLHGPLEDAAGRVRTFADAYSILDLEHAEEMTVAMKPYIEVLLDRIERAAVPRNIILYREIENLTVPRETAAAIGLYLNEAISNALKYAFPSGAGGSIGVYFNVDGDNWQLFVEDDGVGDAAIKDVAGGLGSRLMAAFASQARAEHISGATEKGYRTELSAGGGRK